jgi:hypothetical protein
MDQELISAAVAHEIVNRGACMWLCARGCGVKGTGSKSWVGQCGSGTSATLCVCAKGVWYGGEREDSWVSMGVGVAHKMGRTWICVRLS